MSVHVPYFYGNSDPQYPLGIIGTRPRAYGIFRAYEDMEGRQIKIMTKWENVIQNKIQDFKHFFQKPKFCSVPTYEVGSM
jgi:hypothetical protein